MSRAILFGGGYQLINFILLMAQAIVLPSYLGLDEYGVGLFIVVPVLIFGGLWEPIVQRFCISGGGISRNWFIIAGACSLSFYLSYLCVVLSGALKVASIILGGVFFIEYIFSIYFIAIMQSEKKYARVFLFSLIGLCVSLVTFGMGASFLLVPLFYCLYFLPVFLFGAFLKKKSPISSVAESSFELVMNAISTRVFYIAINNLYVVVVGILFGPSKAAVFRVVVSVCSALRFCNPLSIGQFHSMIESGAWRKNISLALLPLSIFYISMVVFLAVKPWVDEYSHLIFGANDKAVIEFLSEIMWYIPLYLWAPYLTLLFSAALSWRLNFLACATSIAISSVFLYFDDLGLFFGSACILYCLLIFFLGWCKCKTC